MLGKLIKSCLRRTSPCETKVLNPAFIAPSTEDKFYSATVSGDYYNRPINKNNFDITIDALIERQEQNSGAEDTTLSSNDNDENPAAEVRFRHYYNDASGKFTSLVDRFIVIDKKKDKIEEINPFQYAYSKEIPELSNDITKKFEDKFKPILLKNVETKKHMVIVNLSCKDRYCMQKNCATDICDTLRWTRPELEAYLIANYTHFLPKDCKGVQLDKLRDYSGKYREQYVVFEVEPVKIPIEYITFKETPTFYSSESVHHDILLNTPVNEKGETIVDKIIIAKNDELLS